MPDPLVILLIGLVIVLGMILGFRANAFFALILAALTISFLVPNPEGQALWSYKVQRVLEQFGTVAGRVAILIIMGAIIGKCMLESRSADRIILTISRLFGEKRVPASLLSAGFVISIPVFYDTTFYLLVPLARSFFKQVRKNYILLLTAIGAGATITHTLVPPTPGPLIAASELKLSIASVMLTGMMTGICLAPLALLGCYFVNWYLPRPRIVDPTLLEEGEAKAEESLLAGEKELPTLFASLAPILLPVVFISCRSILEMLALGPSDTPTEVSRNFVYVFGDANIALMCGAFVAAMVMWQQRKFKLGEFHSKIEAALLDAGLIVMITAAGGAFGAMLHTAGVGERVCGIFQTEDGGLSGLTLLLIAFGISSLIKTAQGSSTVAMITTSSVIAAIILDMTPETLAETLGYHPAYLATAIGLGSIVTGWMNDSGFWVFCRMGGIHEIDAMKTWSVLLAMIGFTGLGIVIVLTRLIPLI